jgi:hypothetical protein
VEPAVRADVGVAVDRHLERRALEQRLGHEVEPELVGALEARLREARVEQQGHEADRARDAPIPSPNGIGPRLSPAVS